MRYFLWLARPEATLALGVTEPTTAGGAVAAGGPAQGERSGVGGAAIGTIDVSTIAVPAEDHLGVTAGTVVQAGTGIHRRTGPMGAGI